MNLMSWLMLAIVFSILVLVIASMFKPKRQRRCDTCVFSSCGRMYPKLSCSIIKRDVYPHNVCEKWK